MHKLEALLGRQARLYGDNLLQLLFELIDSGDLLL